MTVQNARDLGTRRSRRASSVRRALAVPGVAGIVLSSSVMGSAAVAAEATAPAYDAVAIAEPTQAVAATLPQGSDASVPTTAPVAEGAAADATDPAQGAEETPVGEQTTSPAAAAEPQVTPSAAAAAGASDAPTAQATSAPAREGSAAAVTSAPTAQASETASAAPSAAAEATTPAPSVTPGTGTTTSGASYDTASATVRPLLSFKGWRDADGALLSSSDGVPVEIALVDADGNAQTATILLKFVDGVSGYNLPLWPFTKNMDPHEGDYTIRYRVKGAEAWTDAGTVHLTVSLPAAGSSATLVGTGTGLTGTGWSFDGRTNIGGVFKVAVRLTDAQRRTHDVDAPASFTSGTFTISPEQLATVAPSGGVVSVQALSGSEVVGDAVTVAPRASVAAATVTVDGRLALEVADWRSLDGAALRRPSLTLNALDPETGEVLRSYDLGQSVVLPSSGASSYDLDVAGILARAGLEGDGSPLGTGSYSLTLANEDGWTATTDAFTVTAGLPTDAPTEDPTSEPSTEPTATPTAEPTTQPANKPTASPSATAEPSAQPTTEPTTEPTTAPTADAEVVTATTAGVGTLQRIGQAGAKDGPYADGEVATSAEGKIQLTFGGWTTADGSPVAAGSTTTVEVRLVAADGTGSRPVTIEITVPDDGSDASKWVQLWTLTKGLAPSGAATYTIQYRAPGQSDSDWRDLGPVTMSVSAATPGAKASVSVSADGTTVTGTGWTFNDSTTGAVPGLTEGGDLYAVTLTGSWGTSPAGVPLLAPFTNGSFTTSVSAIAAALKAAGVAAGTYDVSLGAGEPVSVTVPADAQPGPVPTPVATDQPVEPITPVDPSTPSPGATDQPITPVDPAQPGQDAQNGAAGGRDVVVTPGEDVIPVRPATDPVPSNPGSDDAASRALRDAAERLAEGRTPTTTAVDAAAAAEAARTVRPASSPVSPVADASALTVANAGSLSGGREGDIVQLILPSSKAQAGDWVSVFLFPGGTTSGWAQVDSDNSVSIDVSALGAGTYQLAVADRDNALLGWAQLEISGTRATTDPDAGIIAVDGTRGALLGPSDWMLISAGGLLMIGAASFVVLANPARVSPRR
ncbi:hypothetical protein [Actinomyces radicidentis]|uniref:hypothetical protein n=1 Tax=Actinomyces radicidentis TaxID=111015 RepID=UPI0026E0D22E|nr:hypothetical protein [Actinomyces radicidentis]